MKVSREFYLQKKFLEKISNPKYPKKLLHEKFKFLFIGQGQVDTWQPLIGFLEPFRFISLEFSIKITISRKLRSFSTRTIIFARSWEIQLSNSNNKELSRPFHMTMQNFTCLYEITSNIFLGLQQNFSSLVQFVESCEIFA